MSHISQYKYQIKNLSLLEKICQEKMYTVTTQPNLEEFAVPMYGSQTQTGVMKIEIPSWRYPLVVDKEGQINYDNFGSAPNSMVDFNDLIQTYNVQTIEANLDHTQFDQMTKTIDENGDIIIELIEY